MTWGQVTLDPSTAGTVLKVRHRSGGTQPAYHPAPIETSGYRDNMHVRRTPRHGQLLVPVIHWVTLTGSRQFAPGYLAGRVVSDMTL